MKHILKDAEFCVEQKCQEWFFSQKWNFSSYSWKTNGGGGAGHSEPGDGINQDFQIESSLGPICHN